MSYLFQGESSLSPNTANQHPRPAKHHHRAWRLLIAVVLGTMAMPLGAIAQTTNFGSLTVSRGTADQGSGRTGGGTSLPAIVSDRDNEGNLCLGFGSSTPDFVLEVTEPLPRVVLRVNSNGNDTTLVVRGPGGVYCGDDTGSSKDASITGTNWSAGTYRVWVGSVTSGMRVNYTLSVVGQ